MRSHDPARVVIDDLQDTCPGTVGQHMIEAVELRHAPKWQLSLAGKTAGQAVRALAWLGPEQAESALRTLKTKLPNAVLLELVMAAPQFPTWLARTVGKVAHG